MHDRFVLGAVLLAFGGLQDKALAAPDSRLEELVVTATRQAEPRLDIAASLTPIGTSEIDLIAATHQAEIMNRVAGVYIQRGSGQESLTAIRSPVLTGPGSCGAFLALEDGLAIRPVGFCNVNDLFEINTEQAGSLEIIRGPGPALYGASAVHGILNFRTPDVAALPALRADIEGGPDQYRRAKLVLRSPGEEPRFGAYGVYTHDGGFRTDSGFDEGKLNVLFDRPLADGMLRIRATGTVLNQETAGFVQGFEAYEDPVLARSNANPEAFRDAYAIRSSASWERSRCEECLDDVRMIVRRSSMEFLQHFLIGKPLEQNDQTSVGLSGAWARPLGDSFVWRVGLDLEGASTGLVEFQQAPATDGSPAANAIRPAGRHYDYSVDGLTAGTHGTLEWMASERWTLAAGVRIERTRYDYDNRMIAGNTDENGVPCSFGGCLYSRPADRSDDFDNVAPKLEARLALTARQRVYAAWSRGFRPPEMTELYRLQRQQTVADLDSEQLDGIELGWRASHERWSASFAGFSLDKQNVILRDANAFNVSNGRTTHRGFEYEGTWQIVPEWSLSASGTVAWHRYAFDRGVEAGEAIPRGNDVDTAPRNVHGLRIGWTPRDRVRAELELLHVGSYYLDASNQHTYGGHTLANLRADYALSPSWRVSARVVNLADEAYADRADFAFGQYRYFPGRERSAFLSITYTAE